jgi:hypothetical protein
MRIPAEERDGPDLGQAWTTIAGHHRDAVLQPRSRRPRPPRRSSTTPPHGGCATRT